MARRYEKLRRENQKNAILESRPSKLEKPIPKTCAAKAIELQLRKYLPPMLHLRPRLLSLLLLLLLLLLLVVVVVLLLLLRLRQMS